MHMINKLPVGILGKEMILASLFDEMSPEAKLITKDNDMLKYEIKINEREVMVFIYTFETSREYKSCELHQEIYTELFENRKGCKHCLTAEFKIRVAGGEYRWERIPVYSRLVNYDGGNMDLATIYFDKRAELLVERASKEYPGKDIEVRWEFEGVGQGHYISNLKL